jgi:hypothetical protein
MELNMDSGDPVPPYLGRVLNDSGEPVGTCFQLQPGTLITACHVLKSLGKESVGARVQVDGLGTRGTTVLATVQRTDQAHDLAVLNRDVPLDGSIEALARTDEVEPLTSLVVTGVSKVVDPGRAYEWLDATGKWEGGAKQDGNVRLGRFTSGAVVPGMSGAPVRRQHDDAVIGVVSARYNSADGWLQNSVWVARTEHFQRLLDGIASLPAWRPALGRRSARTASPATLSPEAFRQQVKWALTTAGYTVDFDRIIGDRKISVIALTHRWNREWRVVVECRPDHRSLTTAQLAKIWTTYEPLHQAGKINELLIVSGKAATPDAIAWVDSKPGIEFQTLPLLLASTLDLSGYLRTAEKVFTESPDGLAEYYVAPYTRDGYDLEDLVLRWLNDAPDSLAPIERPLALLGSYGIGKSSFALRLTSDLATRALGNPNARVPILVRLGEIASEQNLEGLLGNLFTAINLVPGYSFGSFIELNRQGRFVVILDGFDEMKQLLSWPEFKYNLAQLNRLVSGDAKVILLGRPTAFENDDEQSQALHGRNSGPLGSGREADTVDYFELEFAPLEPAQIDQFLSSYIEFRARNMQRDGQVAFTSIREQVQSKQLRDIASRPVQLRMLADILPYYTGSIEELDLVTLYDTFIEQLIQEIMRREEAKRSRLAFDGEARQNFLQRLAFWMWQERSSGVITADRIPNELVEPFAAGRDPRTIRRDLVVASPLDRRYGERIRFAHRSFQEFLVAKDCWRRLEADEMTVSDYDASATNEVATFVKLLRRKHHADLISRLILGVSGTITWRTADSLLLESTAVDRIKERARPRKGARSGALRLTPWQLLLANLPAIERHEPSVSASALLAQVNMSDSRSPDMALLCLFLLAAGCGGTSAGVDSAAISEIAGLLFRGNHGAREEITESQLSRGRARRKMLQVNQDRDELYTREATRRRTSAGKSRAATRSDFEYQFAEDKTPLLPLGMTFVGDARESGRRIGRYSQEETYLDSLKGTGWRSLTIRGATRLEIRWLPQSIVEIARIVSDANVSLDLQTLAPVFAKWLPSVAFLSDWVRPTRMQTNIRFSGRVTLDRQVFADAGFISRAWKDYEAALEKTSKL